MVDPNIINDYKQLMEGETFDIELINKNLSSMYKHAFTQINNDAMVINSYKVTSQEVSGTTIKTVEANNGSAVLQCQCLQIRSLRSNMYGFGVMAKTFQFNSKDNQFIQVQTILIIMWIRTAHNIHHYHRFGVAEITTLFLALTVFNTLAMIAHMDRKLNK